MKNDLENFLAAVEPLTGAILLGVIIICIVALLHPDPKVRAIIALAVLL